MVVVLPAPLVPEEAEDLAGLDLEADPVDPLDVAVGLPKTFYRRRPQPSLRL